ncbi:MAG: tubulin/FtsZ family protein [Dehalococcoidia bacterium]|nr:tubulin/FtsZ family protein [Dehalococcoidia bacterium]
MRVGVIGIGQAGGRVADHLTYHSLWGRHQGIVPFALAVNSAQADLLGLKTIQKKDRILVGQTVVKGHGVGLNRKVGAKVSKHGLHSIMHAVTEKVIHHVDAFFVIAGLGGGTGSGGAPVIISKLRQVYEEPIYLVGILPSEDEGKLMAMNAIECLQEVDGMVNGILLFDNDVWKKEGLPLETSYGIMNHELVKPLPLMLGAGEAQNDRVGIKVIDASDIINSWEGFSYIGYSEMKAKSSRDRFLFFRKKNTSSLDQLSPAMRCYTAIRNAATLRLTGECDIKKAKKALMIIAGSPDELNMEGFSHAKSWLESSISTPEVRGGDCPIKGWDMVAGVVLLAGYTEIPRLGVSINNVKPPVSMKASAIEVE